MPNARPTMLASASGELNTRAPPNARCRPCVTLNTPPLPETSARRSSRLQSATSCAEDDDARVVRHLVLQRAVDGRHHRVGLAVRLGRRLEARRRRVHVRREHPVGGRRSRRLLGGQRAIGRLGDLAIDLRRDLLEVALGGETFGEQELAHPPHRIALRLRRRAPPPSCTTARRPRASASTDARPSRARARDRAARAPTARPPASRGSWRGSRSRRRAGPSGAGSDRPASRCAPPGVCASTGTEIA